MSNKWPQNEAQQCSVSSSLVSVSIQNNLTVRISPEWKRKPTWEVSHNKQETEDFTYEKEVWEEVLKSTKT